LLRRTPGSVSRKLTNFARLDPALQARGIRASQHGAHGEEIVWNEFTDKPELLAFESERMLAAQLGQSIEEVAEIDVADLPPEGREREAIVRLRVNQSFFRSRILSAYEFRCCITGVAVRELLVASHIVPWSEDATNRLNPRNGLCLNALHDRAFDRRLMWVDDDFTVRFAAKIRDSLRPSDPSLSWLLAFDGQPLKLPRKFSPDPQFLRRHAEHCKATA
jgi:putative restriction endonuclease